jgi:hypothetical protein
MRYSPEASVSGTYTPPSQIASPGSQLRTSAGNRMTDAVAAERSSSASSKGRYGGESPAFSHHYETGIIAPARACFGNSKRRSTNR